MEAEERHMEALPCEEGGDVQPAEIPAPSEPERDINKESEFVKKLPSVALGADVRGNPNPFVVPRMDNLVILDQKGNPVQFERLVIVTGGNRQVISSPSHPAIQVLLPQGQLMNVANPTGLLSEKEHEPVITKGRAGAGVTAQNISGAIIRNSPPDIFEPPVKPLPSGAPNWALRLRRCETIGDSYRGYCNTEAELEAILLLHKQQTHAVFGTRQSPSPAKPATRLMWKSQYVPYDGIPFVNAGSRASVMECQFGPRRKGAQPKKGSEQETTQNLYKATCPARIYIKKVQKFLEYKVSTDPKEDKKIVRQEQEKAFFNLKKSSWDDGGIVRYYVQLPTEKAHLYHEVDTGNLPPLPEICNKVEHELKEEDSEELTTEAMQDVLMEDGVPLPSRLHPLVSEKICELVSQGHDQVYTVRKQLRRFVEREMFKTEEVPERHNLCYFPTVNDLKNHIHEAQKALQLKEEPETEWKTEDNHLFPETLTLALTPATVDVSSQKEVLLEGSEILSPDAVRLFSSLTSLQPKIFTHLQAINLQPALCPEEGNVQASKMAQEPLELPIPIIPQTSVLLSPSQFLLSGLRDGESEPECDSTSLLSMSQLAGVSSQVDPGAEGAIAQILLSNGQTVPVQIVQPSSRAHTPSENATVAK